MTPHSDSPDFGEAHDPAHDGWRRIVLENALDAVIGMDEDGNIIEWNRQAEVIFGWTKSEVIGRRLSETVIPDEYRARHERGLRNFLATGEGPFLNHRIEIVGLHRNGSVFPVELTIIPIRTNEPGRRYMFYSFVRDISDRKRAEEKIRDNNRLLESVIEGVAEAIFVKDQHGRYITINMAGAAMLGTTPDKVIGREDREFFPPDAALKIMEDDRKVMTSGEPASFEEYVTISGQRKILSSVKSVYRDHDGAPIGVIGVARDVTEQRYAEDALRESEGRFRALFEQAPFSVQVLGPDGRTRDVNHSWAALWNVPEEAIGDLVLQNYNMLQDPQLEKKGILSYLRRAFLGETVRTPAIRYDPAEIGKPGRARWVEAYMRPIKGTNGEIREVMLIHQDVTESREHEIERDRLVSELQEAIRARDEFLSIASHELKTPITSLKLQAQVVRKRIERDGAKVDPKAIATFTEVSERQVNRLARLVEDMLDISRIAHGRLWIEPEEVDLGELVREVVERFAGQFEATGSPCQTEIESGVVGFWDRYRLDQVISNLLTNAMKYGAGNPIDVNVSSENGTAVIRVRDRGVGIAPKDIERIFQRFERAISASSISGLGLGLYISSQIVEAHQGTIRVESEIGKGSTFIVRLPRSPAAESDAV